MEVGNLKVDLSPCVDLPEVAHISGDREVTISLDDTGSMKLDLDGSSSTAGEDGEDLTFSWSVEGPFAAALIAMARPSSGETPIATRAWTFPTRS